MERATRIVLTMMPSRNSPMHERVMMPPIATVLHTTMFGSDEWVLMLVVMMLVVMGKECVLQHLRTGWSACLPKIRGGGSS